MTGLLVVAAVVGLGCLLLGVLVAPAWLLGVPASLVAALVAHVGPARFLRAVDDDPGAGPAGLHL